jgi:hypothetical protein
VLAWSDVIDMKCKWKELSREMAILAATNRPLPNLSKKARIHE